MIAPFAVDLQISFREALFRKVQALDQVDRSRIPGLDVGFEPVKSQLLKSVVDDEPHPFRHQPFASKIDIGIVTEISILKGTVENLAQISNANNFLSRLATNQ